MTLKIDDDLERRIVDKIVTDLRDGSKLLAQEELIRRLETMDLKPLIDGLLAPLLRQAVVDILANELGQNYRQRGGILQVLREEFDRLDRARADRPTS